MSTAELAPRGTTIPGSATPGPLDTDLVRRLAALVTAAPGRPRQASYAPFDGALIGEVPTCTAEDVAEAQTVAVQRGVPVGPLPGVPLERYAAVMTAGLKALKRTPFLK
jgi:hypothetical protein